MCLEEREANYEEAYDLKISKVFAYQFYSRPALKQSASITIRALGRF
jgi:hypothetical protein